MAKKAKTVFVCQSCGFESPTWMGKCTACGAWNSFVEEKVNDAPEDKVRKRDTATASFSQPVAIASVVSGEQKRLSTGIGELDRVLGGGLVPGSLCLISGEPGIGKSTLIIQAAVNMANEDPSRPVLYVSGEESEEQIRMRADRVARTLPANLYLLAETELDRALEVTKELNPRFLIVDSIQTMYTGELDSAPGTVAQVRTCTHMLMQLGKGRGIPVFIVAHVNKSGDLAGPKIMEHLVDTVLNFTGERSQELRILCAYKNRFGATSEIGAFRMEEEGLVPVENLSKSFLEGLDDRTDGACAAAVYEGTRPLLLEIQALTAPCNIGFAKRTCIGFDYNRLGMILAVLERKAGVSLISQDVYLNVAGGLRLEGTSADLPAALAVYSSYKNVPCGQSTIAFGEISLTGDVRSVQNADKLVKEAARLGFKRILLPKKNAERLKDVPADVKLVPVSTLREAIAALTK